MKKKSRLHEFEKNNRVINIEQARQERRTRLDEQKQKNGIVPVAELDIVEKTKKRKVPPGEMFTIHADTRRTGVV